MEVDQEFDQKLLQQFSCLNTQDRDVLISEFSALVGNQLNTRGCEFYLDMNNWNLQAAVCSFFDLTLPKEKLPKLSFLRDVTIGGEEPVPPNTKFLKTLRLQNPGDEQWPPGCSLKFVEGEKMTNVDRIIIDPLLPSQATDISIEMISPDKTGIYQGKWRTSTATGSYFGEPIWIIVTVAEGGTLGLTQQLSQLNELGAPVQPQPPCQINPFGPKLDASFTENTFTLTTNLVQPEQRSFYPVPENNEEDTMNH